MAPKPARNEIGDLDVEADEFVRLSGIRFDKGRAAFGVGGPTEFGRWHCRGDERRS
ncbi:MAG TPA: hypothetical protein VFO00_03460 [Vitreimonas sp.]|nr:hypothetical protein [Vitreimonas sp.]